MGKLKWDELLAGIIFSKLDDRWLFKWVGFDIVPEIYKEILDTIKDKDSL